MYPQLSIVNWILQAEDLVFSRTIYNLKTIWFILIVHIGICFLAFRQIMYLGENTAQIYEEELNIMKRASAHLFISKWCVCAYMHVCLRVCVYLCVYVCVYTCVP